MQQLGAISPPTAANEFRGGRGIVQDTSTKLPDLGISDRAYTLGEAPDFVTGDVYADGSLLHGRHAAIKRAGWCFAQVNDSGEQTFAVYGPLPRPQDEQSIFRAELHAVCMALQAGMVPLTIWSDCKNVVDGFARGLEWRARCSNPHASQWKWAWHLVLELGGLGPQAVQIKK